MSIQIGQPAPQLSLYNTDKELVNLSDHRGSNVLLLFFPAAFTGICTDEMCSVRDSLADYNNMDAVVYGISCDSLFVLGKFKEDNNLGFGLLSDYNKVAVADFGCQYDDFVFGMKGNAKRSAFIIDKAGVVQYAQVNDHAPDLPDFDKIKEKLTELQAQEA